MTTLMTDAGVRAAYLDYLDQLRASQWDGPHPSDVDNVPMTLEEFVEYRLAAELVRLEERYCR